MTRAAKRIQTTPRQARDATAPLPAMRTMTVIAQDPSVRANGTNRGPILMAKISVPAETLVPGPIGYRVQVVDYDASSRRFHGAHVLPGADDPVPPAWENGDPDIVGDFRFHAQNVYALVMKTLARFEFALGRRVGWSFGAHQLKVAPHGMLDANAFYSPREEGLVFGYFPGANGEPIYTCLSHDVIVHETTHALIDALRTRYLDPSSADQAALHEGFADVIALLSVFSQPELIAQLLRPGSKRAKSPPLIAKDKVAPNALRKTALFGLAEQFGEMEGVRGAALRRSAELEPNPGLLETPEFLEPHRRGEIFVAAVMNGFLEAWSRRIAKSAVPGQSDYPVQRVAEDGADVAAALGIMWIRALDYMPPVHVVFGDALSAALTADLEVRPDDSRFGLREHMLHSFRSYGMEPASRTKTPDGIWEPAPAGLRYDRVRFESMRSDRDEVFRFVWDNRDRLWTESKAHDLQRAAYSRVLSVRPCVRVGPDGFVLRETVAEYYQVARLTPDELRRAGIVVPAQYLESLRRAQAPARRRPSSRAAEDDADTDGPIAADDDEEEATTPLYGGGTLVFDEYGRLKYHVHKDVFDPKRQAARVAYLWETGLLQAGSDGARLKMSRLSTMHRLRAIDARRFPAEGW